MHVEIKPTFTPDGLIALSRKRETEFDRLTSYLKKNPLNFSWETKGSKLYLPGVNINNRVDERSQSSSLKRSSSQEQRSPLTLQA